MIHFLSLFYTGLKLKIKFSINLLGLEFWETAQLVLLTLQSNFFHQISKRKRQIFCVIAGGGS